MFWCQNGFIYWLDKLNNQGRGRDVSRMTQYIVS